jgi:hypothetical protein
MRSSKMKTTREIVKAAMSATLAVGMMMNFGGCSKQSPMESFSQIQEDESSLPPSLQKTVKAPQLFDEEMAYPAEEGKTPDDIKLKSQGFGVLKAEFKLIELAVSEPTQLRLQKMGKTINRYQLTPFGLSVPNGIEIKFEYKDNKLLPEGKTEEDDLKIFQIVNNETKELETKIDKKVDSRNNTYFKVKALTTAYETGEFFLGYYDENNQPIATDGLLIVSLGNDMFQVGEKVEVRGMITVDKGGELEFRNKWKNGDQKFDLKMVLKVEPGSINQDAEFILSMDQERFICDLDVVFHPHGIIFSKPALLDIEASGLNLKGLGANSLGFFYDNTDSSEWEKMVFKQLKVDTRRGKISLKGAQLPHFSRYAVGSE